MRFCCTLLGTLLFLCLVPGQVRAHHLKCQAEEELVRLAQEVLDRANLPRGQAVQAALIRVGSDLPNVEVVRAPRSQQPRLNEWFSRWRAQVDGKAVCGVARGKGRTVLVVGERLATLRSERKAGRFSVLLEPNVKAAYGFALLRDGNVRHAPIEKGKLEFEEGKDLLSVQVVGHTAHGPLPLAQWEAKPPLVSATATEEIDPYVWHTQLYRTLYESSGIHQPARRNQSLEAAAKEYGGRICAERRASHRADGLSAIDRVAEQGLDARDLGEVVARAPTLASALSGLLRSASHRLVLLDKRMTDVGFGIHRTSEEVCVVGLFASWPRPVSWEPGQL